MLMNFDPNAQSALGENACKTQAEIHPAAILIGRIMLPLLINIRVHKHSLR